MISNRQYLIIILLCIITKIQFANAQNQHSVTYKVTPKTFDSIATFSFVNSKSDTVSLLIFDRWGTTVAKIISSKYFLDGEHDTTCNLSFLKPGKYLSVLLVSAAKNTNRTDLEIDKEKSLKEIITKCSPTKR